MGNSKRISLLKSLLGILAVGIIDYLTGTELRVFPLYYLPLIYSIRHTGAYFVAFVSSISWLLSMYFGGGVYSHHYIWVFNFFSQAIAFLLVSHLLVQLDSTLKKEQEISRIDYLTGLANRRSFFELASAVVSLCDRNRKPVAIAYVDLDNFKQANDKYGHQHGDKLLQKAATVFRETFRKSDVIARFGGDEFAILMPEMMKADAKLVLERIQEQLAQDPEFQLCSVTVSIGAVSYAKAPTDISSMVRAADELMYRVKQTGKNQLSVVEYG